MHVKKSSSSFRKVNGCIGRFKGCPILLEEIEKDLTTLPKGKGSSIVAFSRRLEKNLWKSWHRAVDWWIMQISRPDSMRNFAWCRVREFAKVIVKFYICGYYKWKVEIKNEVFYILETVRKLNGLKVKISPCPEEVAGSLLPPALNILSYSNKIKNNDKGKK